jgi:2-haloacid dehalogenase
MQGETMIKVIAFDVFGTVFNLSGVERSDLKAYAEHIKKPEWSPLHLKSWETLPAHLDSATGISLLRHKYTVVTCSNGPLGLLSKLSKYNDISWDAIIPLELNKVFKPNPKAYMTVCEVMGVEPSEVMMVTANEHFGDLEASAALGMTPMLIRKDINSNIIDLYVKLC